MYIVNISEISKWWDFLIPNRCVTFEELEYALQLFSDKGWEIEFETIWERRVYWDECSSLGFWVSELIFYKKGKR